MQSDQGLHCPLTESLNTTSMNGEKRIRGYFVHVQDDVNLHILRSLEGTFSLGMAIALKAFFFFSTEKYLYFSYFWMKTYVVGIH